MLSINLSNIEVNFWECWEWTVGPPGEKLECFLCAVQSPIPSLHLLILSRFDHSELHSKKRSKQKMKWNFILNLLELQEMPSHKKSFGLKVKQKKNSSLVKIIFYYEFGTMKKAVFFCSLSLYEPEVCSWMTNNQILNEASIKLYRSKYSQKLLYWKKPGW